MNYFNKNLQAAKIAKNDEFYTQYEDIEKEISNYKHYLENKIIYCNCDNPNWSNFYIYLKNNFDILKLKKVITTHYTNDQKSYSLELFKDENNNLVDKVIFLDGNGDFRNDESIEILKSVDIVISNPPFSLFKEYIDILMKYNKEFLIIGSQNSITYKNVFQYIKDNKIWFGLNFVKKFIEPNKNIKSFGNICWFTNLDNEKRNQEHLLLEKYQDNKYDICDDYDAINVDRIKDIPYDYKGVIAVPITFFDKYNPKQFEIIDMFSPIVNNKKIYKRLFIKIKNI